ncbi:RNA-dependent RNA polymerase [Magnaporthe oryzae botourmiavirus 7]|uniref:RNA-dependent RNA polymerase n=1 Tax=Magnaporthe oryzae botourmiavirus 7 TaxID=2755484 RepID=A0A7D5Y292_9VIRU|nr:RNA-dependent RNA polymerase [Magnaporthe oryzae botourmiavirus 7]QLJ94431.1 RNA-dependent RNA polymerase [Magnaporthe oryzae botourmiavirus 7]
MCSERQRDVAPPSADYSAPGACQTFRHKVGTASTRAISFLSATFKRDIPYEPVVIQQSCSEYTAYWKRFFSSFLIRVLEEGGGDPEEVTFAASLASVPKCWPQSCPCMNETLENELKDRLDKGKLTLPEGYLEFVRSKIRCLFPRGIREKQVKKAAKLVTPPFKSTTANGRETGGSFAYWRGRQEEYLSTVLDPVVVHTPEFMVAPAPGKPRPLVKNDPTYLYLKPLHKILYDTISREDWLLRGDVKRKSFLRAGFSPGKKYLSADFTAATDNLPIEVAETILDELLRLSSHSLTPLFLEALGSLRPLISFSDCVKSPSRGQLMGNLLSFPLLCIQNWIAACYVDEVVGEITPKLVNGDDLAVQASEQWVFHYRRLAPSFGFHLNEKKTCWSTSLLTMNSTYFTRNFKVIPYVKCGAMRTEDPRDLASAWDTMVGVFARVRSSWFRRVSRSFLSFFSRIIRLSRRTVHALGIRFPVWSGVSMPRDLWNREKRRVRPELPLPRVPSGMHPDLVPYNDPEGLAEGREIAEAICAAHWEMDEYEPLAKMKFSERAELFREGVTRRGKERACEARCRLMTKETAEKMVWVPKSIQDCLDLTHERVTLGDDGYLSFTECELCSRVEDSKRSKIQPFVMTNEMRLWNEAFHARKDWGMFSGERVDC